MAVSSPDDKDNLDPPVSPGGSKQNRKRKARQRKKAQQRAGEQVQPTNEVEENVDDAGNAVDDATAEKDDTVAQQVTDNQDEENIEEQADKQENLLNEERENLANQPEDINDRVSDESGTAAAEELQEGEGYPQEGEEAEEYKAISLEATQRIVHNFRQLANHEKVEAFQRLLHELPLEHMAAQLCLVNVNGDNEVQGEMSAMYQQHIVALQRDDPILAAEAIDIAKALLTLHSECKRTVQQEGFEQEPQKPTHKKIMENKNTRMAICVAGFVMFLSAVAGFAMEAWNTGVIMSTFTAAVLIMIVMHYMGFDDQETDTAKIERMMQSELWQKLWESLYNDDFDMRHPSESAADGEGIIEDFAKDTPATCSDKSATEKVAQEEAQQQSVESKKKR